MDKHLQQAKFAELWHHNIVWRLTYLHAILQHKLRKGKLFIEISQYNIQQFAYPASFHE